MKIEGAYYNGLFDSTWTYYNINGMKVGDGHYNKGNGYQRAYYPNGKPRLYVPYVNNKRNGYELQYDQNGEIVVKTLYKDDAIVK